MLLSVFSRVEQADLTLVVVDCAHLPSDAQQAAGFLQEHLGSVLSTKEQPEAGMWKMQRVLTKCLYLMTCISMYKTKFNES